MIDIVCDLSHHNGNPDYAAAAAGGINPPSAPAPGFGHCDRDRFNGDLAHLQRLSPH